MGEWSVGEWSVGEWSITSSSGMLCYHASYVTAEFKVEPSEIRISGRYIILLLFSLQSSLH